MPLTFVKMPIVDSNTARSRRGEKGSVMAIDFVSALISLVSVACPIIAGLIPGKPIPETVLLLLAGALLGPHRRSECHSVYRRHQPAVRFGPRLPVPSRRLRDIAEEPHRHGGEARRRLPGRSPSPSRSSSWPFGRRCRPSSWTAWPWSSRSLPRPWARFCPFCRSAASWARGWGTRSSPTAPGASCFPSSPWRFCSRPGPPGRPWSSSSRSSPSPWRPPPCRRSPSASAATCTGSSSPMPTPTRRWSSVR